MALQLRPADRPMPLAASGTVASLLTRRSPLHGTASPHLPHGNGGSNRCSRKWSCLENRGCRLNHGSIEYCRTISNKLEDLHRSTAIEYGFCVSHPAGHETRQEIIDTFAGRLRELHLDCGKPSFTNRTKVPPDREPAATGFDQRGDERQADAIAGFCNVAGPRHARAFTCLQGRRCHATMTESRHGFAHGRNLRRHSMPCLNRCALEVGGQPPSMLLPNLNRLVLTPPPRL